MKRNGNNRAMMASKTRIPEGWRLVRLGDVAEANRSGWSRSDDATILYLDLTSIVVPGIMSCPKELAAAEAPSRARRRVHSGDILVSTVRPNLRGFARVREAPKNLIASTGFAVLTPMSDVDGSYVYHHVMTQQFADYLEKATTGQAYPAVRPADVTNFVLPIPPLPEQRAIAAVLDSIDDAIERTAAVIAATEQLRDSLLHELLTRGVPGWHSEWKDVPGLGTIPADWEVVSMGEVYEVQLGKMLSPKAKQGANPKPYLTNRNVRWGGFDLADLPTMDFDEREIKKFQLRQGDLMICEGGDTGRAAVWEEPIVDCYYQKALHRLRPKGNTEIPKFMLAVLMFYGNNGILLEYSEQTSISHLTRERLLRMPVPNPPRTEQQGIADTLDCIEFVLIQSQEEQDRLESLKHSVADGLLTGNLRISLPSVSTQCGLSDV